MKPSFLSHQTIQLKQTKNRFTFKCVSGGESGRHFVAVCLNVVVLGTDGGLMHMKCIQQQMFQKRRRVKTPLLRQYKDALTLILWRLWRQVVPT